MAAEIHRLRDKAGETEKITINLGYVDLHSFARPEHAAELMLAGELLKPCR